MIALHAIDIHSKELKIPESESHIERGVFVSSINIREDIVHRPALKRVPCNSTLWWLHVGVKIFSEHCLIEWYRRRVRWNICNKEGNVGVNDCLSQGQNYVFNLCEGSSTENQKCDTDGKHHACLFVPCLMRLKILLHYRFQTSIQLWDALLKTYLSCLLKKTIILRITCSSGETSNYPMNTIPTIMPNRMANERKKNRSMFLVIIDIG